MEEKVGYLECEILMSKIVEEKESEALRIPRIAEAKSEAEKTVFGNLTVMREHVKQILKRGKLFEADLNSLDAVAVLQRMDDKLSAFLVKYTETLDTIKSSEEKKLDVLGKLDKLLPG